jgi:hypothetical protein
MQFPPNDNRNTIQNTQKQEAQDVTMDSPFGVLADLPLDTYPLHPLQDAWHMTSQHYLPRREGGELVSSATPVL